MNPQRGFTFRLSKRICECARNIMHRMMLPQSECRIAAFAHIHIQSDLHPQITHIFRLALLKKCV
jgi:hypothetical protein